MSQTYGRLASYAIVGMKDAVKFTLSVFERDPGWNCDT